MSIEFKTSKPEEFDDYLDASLTRDARECIIIYSSKDREWIDKEVEEDDRKVWYSWLEREIGKGVVMLNQKSEIREEIIRVLLEVTKKFDVKFAINNTFKKLDEDLLLKFASGGKHIVGGYAAYREFSKAKNTGGYNVV